MSTETQRAEQAPGFMQQIKAAKESVATGEPWMQAAAATASTPTIGAKPATLSDFIRSDDSTRAAIGADGQGSGFRD